MLKPVNKKKKNYTTCGQMIYQGPDPPNTHSLEMARPALGAVSQPERRIALLSVHCQHVSRAHPDYPLSPYINKGKEGTII